ncbi:MAG: tetratricopeptide repeat protein [Planctomycetota bacterium]
MNPDPLLETRPRKRLQVVLVALLLAVTGYVFWPSLSYPFVGWDDPALIGQNPYYRGLSLEHLRWMFTSFLMGHFQPLTWISYGADYLLWGMDPRGYHLTNLLAHLVSVALVFLVARQILRLTVARADRTAGPDLAAALAALFFAIHPLRVESVVWVTERRDVLSLMFLLAAFFCYLHSATGTTAQKRWYVLSLFAFALSLLSKAWGMTFPVLLLIVDLYPLRRRTPGGRERSSWTRLLLEKLPFAILVVPIIALALQAQHSSTAMLGLEKHSLLHRVAQSIYGLCWYPWKMLAPTRLSPLVEIEPDFNPLAAEHLLCLGCLVVVFVLLLLLRRRWPALLAAAISYAVLVSPVLGLVQSGPQKVADRYSYLSCLPFTFLLAGLLFLLWKRIASGRGRLLFAGAVGLAMALVLGGLTRRQLPFWSDTDVLWTRVWDMDPDSYMGPYNLGVSRMREARYAEALELYERSYENNPDFVPNLINLAKMNDVQGNPERARMLFDRAVEEGPDEIFSWLNRGISRSQHGDSERAIDDLAHVLEREPDNQLALLHRGLAYQNLRRHDRAVLDLGFLLALRPGDPAVLCHRGYNLEHSGEPYRAIADYSQALRIDPDMTRARFRRGHVLLGLDQAQPALADLEIAVQQAAGDWRIHRDLGRAQLMLGKPEEGVRALERALALAPEGQKPAIQALLREDH